MFGIADEEELALVKPVARALIARDALRADDYGGLSFGPGGQADPEGRARQLEIVCRRSARSRAPQAGAEYPHDPLFEALRARRRELAAEAGVPPYVIFHDSTLREMAELKPATLDALSRVSGVGAAKLERYGDAFVEVIAAMGDGMNVPAARREDAGRRPDRPGRCRRRGGAGRHD